jgi:non-ribosomal peptide synthetase component E (peptide arylation enzyme)
MGRVTLIELLEHSAAEHGPQPALTSSGGRQLTHQELQAAIDNTASQFRRIGVKPGHLVSLAFPNTLELVGDFSQFMA